MHKQLRAVISLEKYDQMYQLRIESGSCLNTQRNRQE